MQINRGVYKKTYARWAEIAHQAEEFGAIMTLTFQPISKNVVSQGHSRGGNALGLQAITQNWVTMTIEWSNAVHDKKAHSLARKFGDAVESVANDAGTLLPFRFMNDASFDQNPLGHYGGENVAMLKAVSRRYDSPRLFQKLQNNGFLLRDLS